MMNDGLRLALAELDAHREKLLKARKEGDMTIAEIDEVRSSIEHGIIRTKIEDWDSLVWDIVAGNDLRAVCAYLLANNVLYNRCSQDYSPLMFATLCGHVEIVRMLLEHGWDADEWTEPDHETPLFLAAFKGFGDIFFLLLEKGASLHLVGYDNGCISYDHGHGSDGEKFEITPADLLYGALVGRNAEICRFLAENLADEEAWLRCERVPWHLYGEETRKFCLASGIELLSSRFVSALDNRLKTDWKSMG